MPESAITPKRRVSQAPIKYIACFGGCGVTVEYRTTPRVYCPPCKSAKRLASARVSMEKQRRKRGIARVKGTTAPCRVCGKPVVRNRNTRARYCPTCAEAHYAEKARRTSVAKRQTEEGRAYLNEWARKRRKSDPAWGVASHMRLMIYRAFGKKKEGRSWRAFVPYTLEQLMRHLERQFLPGMTWKNRSRWHIDHIRPLSMFSFESAADPGFKEAWALSNLRPLWSLDNLKKNARRTHLL